MVEGPLVIIGGHEDKTGDRVILREVARRLGGGKLVVATVASHEPEGYFDSYRQGFEGLGVGELVELYVEDRAESQDEARLALFDGAAGVFFSGGDQLRLSSQIGDTPIERRIRDLHARGGVIAGTSAGASVMSETMLVKGPSAESYRIGEVHMAPGLGLLPNVIIDQHFAERGRFGRLLGAVAHNPRLMGLGIDENTAVVVEQGGLQVIGDGAVYVVDGEEATHTNISEGRAEDALSMFDVRLHVLSQDDRFNLDRRRPERAGSRGASASIDPQ
ncbi:MULTISPECIES: cyanophycinase [unclassified Brevundimonas]|uniref:cyanophycinase n=1 Tax=unclassified Brevundimonas TaxID=2622653 RepID=UPI0025B7E99A|nr:MULTISPECIES: cyanophycinase [unclassified Brevundimonas]